MQKCSFIIIAFLAFVQVAAQVDTSQYVIQNRYNSKVQQKKPYVIMISVDGLRYDYLEKYKASNLLRLGSSGVRAESMIPSFPSLTFPNHYTIATGLYPSHHGLVNNNFYDERLSATYTMSNKQKVRDEAWYGGTPLWVLAEQQQMVTASFYWVGSEAPVKGIHPTYYYYYNEKIKIDRRIQVVVDWLKLPEDRRPHLITFYFSEVDHEGHTYGPEAIETARSVQYIDSSIQLLTEAVKATGLPVNFILVSDHGMTQVDTKNPLRLPADVDTSKFVIPAEGNLIEMYAKDKADILPTYQLLKRQEQDYKVYLKTNVPVWWHYGHKDDLFNRIGDILVVPKWPRVFNIRNRKISPGWHGFDPYLVKDMHATFYAWGPAFKNNKIIPSFENIHVYPMVTEILGLKVTDRIDGKKKVLKEILK